MILADLFFLIWANVEWASLPAGQRSTLDHELIISILTCPEFDSCMSEFYAMVKKILSSVSGQSTGQEPAHSHVTVPCVWMEAGVRRFSRSCEKIFFLSRGALVLALAG